MPVIPRSQRTAGIGTPQLIAAGAEDFGSLLARGRRAPLDLRPAAARSAARTRQVNADQTRQAGRAFADAGQAVSNAAFSLSDTLHKVRNQVVAAEEAQRNATQTAQINQLKVQAARRLNDLKLDIQQDPEIDDPQQAFQERAEQIRLELTQDITDPDVLDQFDLAYLQAQEPVRVAARKLAYDRQIDGALAELDEQLSSYLDLIGDATNEGERQTHRDQAHAALDSAADAALISESEAGKRRRAFDEAVAIDQAQQLILQDPGRAKNLLRDESYLPDLDPGKRNQLERSARARENALRAERAFERAQADSTDKARRDRTLADLQIAVERGTAGHEAIDKADAAGLFEDRQAKRVELTRKADRQAQEKVDRQHQIARVGRAYTGAAVLDPNDPVDRDALNLHYNQVIAPQIADMLETDPAQASQITVDYAARTGMVPDAVQSQIRAGLRAGAPAQRAYAAEMLGRLTDNAPALSAEFSGADIAFGKHVLTLRTTGVEPADAVRLADEARSLDQATRDRRRELWREEDQPEAAALFLRDKSSGGLFGADTNIPDRLLGEFRNLTRTHYLTTGDVEAARETAWSQVSRVWAPSRVGTGDERWMKYAPERWGPTALSADENADWMTDQLVADVAEEGAFDPEAGDLRQRLRIAADARTGREAGGAAPPSYAVLLRNANTGAFEPMFDADGARLRWQPNWSQSARKAELDTALEQDTREAVEAARRLRQQRGFSPWTADTHPDYRQGAQ